MDFSPYEARGKFAAPNQNYIDPLRVTYNNAGAQALARESGKMGMAVWGGALALKEQVDSAKSLEANNEYNRLMSEGTAELMQRKQEKALNIVEDYDKLQQKTLDQVRKKYGGYINYGKAAIEFDNFTTRDNATRRANMVKYQLAETDSYHETQYANSLATCNQMVLDGGGSDEAIESASNRMAGLVENRYANYGEAKIKEQERILKGQLVSSALSMAVNMQDYARMGHLANKYAEYLDPKTRISVLSMFGKRQKEARELAEANDVFSMLGENATRDEIKNLIRARNGNMGDTEKLFSHCDSLIGEEMPNGRNGCVEAVLRQAAPFFKFAADHKNEVNVGSLCRLAMDSGDASIKRYNGGDIPAGSVIVYFDEDDAVTGDVEADSENAAHVTMADGAGGYYGNSSSARDYEDEAGNTVRGNGCVIHSDAQDIGGYKIGYVISMDEKTMQQMDELEIEEQTEKIWRRQQAMAREAKANRNELITKGSLEIQDLFNHDNMDESAYRGVIERYWAESGYNDEVRIRLETDVNARLKTLQRAAEAEARRTAGGGSGRGSGGTGGGGGGKKTSDPLARNKLETLFNQGASKEDLLNLIVDENLSNADSLIKFVDGLFGEDGKTAEKLYKNFRNMFFESANIKTSGDEKDTNANLQFSMASEFVRQKMVDYRREKGYEPSQAQIGEWFKEAAVKVTVPAGDVQEQGFVDNVKSWLFGGSSANGSMLRSQLYDVGIYNEPYEHNGGWVVETKTGIATISEETLRGILNNHENADHVIFGKSGRPGVDE